MNKELEDRYLSVIEDNINVGKSSAVKEFFILAAGIVGVCFAVYFCAGLLANFWIDRMSVETQVKIEQFFAREYKQSDKPKHEKIVYLESVKPKIIEMDKNLQNRSEFPIYEDKSDEINAFIAPDGTIHFTSAILKELDDKESLTFVLAHELAHYSHRDYLRTIGRELIAGSVLFVLSMGQADITNLIKGASAISGVQYSQSQERAADLYANAVLMKLYGRNDGAVNFFEMLNKKENVPEFLYYFSSHPPTSERIRYLKNAR